MSGAIRQELFCDGAWGGVECPLGAPTFFAWGLDIASNYGIIVRKERGVGELDSWIP